MFKVLSKITRKIFRENEINIDEDNKVKYIDKDIEKRKSIEIEDSKNEIIMYKYTKELYIKNEESNSYKYECTYKSNEDFKINDIFEYNNTIYIVTDIDKDIVFLKEHVSVYLDEAHHESYENEYWEEIERIEEDQEFEERCRFIDEEIRGIRELEEKWYWEEIERIEEDQEFEERCRFIDEEIRGIRELEEKWYWEEIERIEEDQEFEERCRFIDEEIRGIRELEEKWHWEEAEIIEVEQELNDRCRYRY